MTRMSAACAGTLLVLCTLALPASADTIREHVSAAEGDAVWGGREYIVLTRDPDRPVTVVEGAARWSGYRQTQIDVRRPPVESHPMRRILDLFE